LERQAKVNGYNSHAVTFFPNIPYSKHYVASEQEYHSGFEVKILSKFSSV
jgi:hypothetical protein